MTLSIQEILSLPMSEIIARDTTPEHVKKDIARRSKRLEYNKDRADRKRKQAQALKEQLMSTGGGWICAYICNGGEPDAHAERGLIARPLDVATEILNARFDGRYYPQCEFQGISRYQYKGPKLTYRPYRFLATDFINDFGGLATEKSKLGTCFSPKVELAQRSWQMKDPSEQGVDDIAKSQWPRGRFAKKRNPDERIQDWGSGKETFDWRPYRGPTYKQEQERQQSDWAAEVARVNAERRLQTA